MARRQSPVRNPLDLDAGSEASLLDVIDNVLNKGAVLNGDLILGVANVDLIYAKLSVLLAALDKITQQERARRRKTEERRTKRKTKKRRTNIEGRSRRY